MWTPGAPPPDNLYPHVSALTVGVHDGLLGWVRSRLREAGHETIEVYGQFPAQGSTAGHLVLFPFQIGPDPKLAETGTAGPLLGASRTEAPPNVPRSMVELGRATTDALTALFGERTLDPSPRPLASMPAPLARWYRDRKDTPWLDGPDEAARGRLPALTWRPGLSMALRYLAVAGEPGRGVSERTSVGAPVSLRALSVIAAAVHLERVFLAQLPAQPLPADLVTYVDALAAASSPEVRERLERARQDATAPITAPIAVHPVSELRDETFTNLMQALQRPLQATLVLQIRMAVAAFAAFEPAAIPHVHGRVMAR